MSNFGHRNLTSQVLQKVLPSPAIKCVCRPSTKKNFSSHQPRLRPAAAKLVNSIQRLKFKDIVHGEGGAGVVSILGPTEGRGQNPTPEYQQASRMATSQLKEP